MCGCVAPQCLQPQRSVRTWFNVYHGLINICNYSKVLSLATVFIQVNLLLCPAGDNSRFILGWAVNYSVRKACVTILKIVPSHLTFIKRCVYLFLIWSSQWSCSSSCEGRGGSCDNGWTMEANVWRHGSRNSQPLSSVPWPWAAGSCDQTRKD